MAATSIWGHREYVVANAVAQHPGSWDRRVIRILDGGPIAIDEVGFWVTWRGETNEIRMWDGATPRELRAALVTRFRDPAIRVWNDTVTEQWRDDWIEPGTGVIDEVRPYATRVQYRNRTILCHARTLEELYSRVRQSVDLQVPFGLAHEGRELEELQGPTNAEVVLRGEDRPVPVFVQTEEGRTLTIHAWNPQNLRDQICDRLHRASVEIRDSCGREIQTLQRDMTVRLLYRLRGGMEDADALDVHEQPEDWSEVDRYEDHFMYPPKVRPPEFFSDTGKYEEPEATAAILKRNQPRGDVWVLPGPDDYSGSVYASVHLGDTTHKVLIHPFASIRKVADAFGLGEVRGHKVTPERAYGWGKWMRTREDVEVWIVGSNPDNRCFLKVDVDGKKYEGQVRRDRTIEQLMKLMGEKGELKTCEVVTYALLHEDLRRGNWPDRGELTITTHKPKEEAVVWAWGPTIMDRGGRLMHYSKDILMWGRLKHSVPNR
jgi:hypothetical protein